MELQSFNHLTKRVISFVLFMFSKRKQHAEKNNRHLENIMKACYLHIDVKKNHSFIPIVIERILTNKFINWISRINE